MDRSAKRTSGRSEIKMIDVGKKPVTRREAVACGSIRMKPQTLTLIREGNLAKGDVLAAARLAGITGAKRCPDLVPLCHPVQIEHVAIEVALDEKIPGANITASVSGEARTGFEMEALTAVAAAALTVYDMCKPVDPGMVIEAIRLLKKSGGKSGRVTFA